MRMNPRARSDHLGVVSWRLLTCWHVADHLNVVSVHTPGVLPILAGMLVPPKGDEVSVAIGLHLSKRIPG